MNAIKKPSQSEVLMSAFNAACESLGVSRKDKSAILGVDTSTLSRKVNVGFEPSSKTGELQLHFIRLYRSLYSIAGGDKAFMQHWFSTDNKSLNGSPKALCLSIEGLFRTNQYLDAMRGKV
tara:strand:- start:1839 stop:2201 length:363 start_codon:yes stop_codon:yes gene_type:complete